MNEHIEPMDFSLNYIKLKCGDELLAVTYLDDENDIFHVMDPIQILTVNEVNKTTRSVEQFFSYVPYIPFSDENDIVLIYDDILHFLDMEPQIHEFYFKLRDRYYPSADVTTH